MVQKKNITYPTDNKLHWKIINKCIVIADKEAIGIRQSYTRTLKRLLMDQRFRNHPKNNNDCRHTGKKIRKSAMRG